jgi:hypothetical protein
MGWGGGAAAAVLAIAAAGCSTLEARSETAPDADLAAIRTWAWMEGQSRGSEGSPEDREHLVAVAAAALEAGLGARGLVPAAAGASPDAWVAFRADVDQETSTVAFTSHGNRSWSWSGFTGRPGDMETEVVTTTWSRGTLVVDVVDPKSSRLLWRATATGEYDPADPRAERATVVREAMAAATRLWPGPAAAKP